MTELATCSLPRCLGSGQEPGTPPEVCLKWPWDLFTWLVFSGENVQGRRAGGQPPALESQPLSSHSQPGSSPRAPAWQLAVGHVHRKWLLLTLPCGLSCP